MDVRYFFIAFIVISFFVDLRLPLPGFLALPVSVITTIICFISALCFCPKQFINDIKHISLSKNNTLWIYILFFAFIFAITIIQVIIGRTAWYSPIRVIMQYGISLLLTLSIAIFTSYRIIKTKSLIKLVYGTLYFILVLGIIDFIAYSINIVPLQELLSYFHNTHIALGEKFEKAFVFGLPRVQSVYFEPGFFAEYLFLFLPILYSLSLSKYQIFKSKFINKFIKITTIPLAWINLILTLSPIWLVFSGISTGIYFGIIIIKNFKKKYKKYLTILGFLCIPLTCLSFPILNINWQNTQIARIQTVIETFGNINYLIFAEQSLGTRLVNIINLIDIGKEHPIIGCGQSKILPLMEKQILMQKSPVYVTPEVNKMMLKKKPTLQNPPLTDIFVRFGIIALILYYAFIIKTIIALYKFKKYTSSVLRNFMYGLSGTIISYIISSCYDIQISNLMTIMIIGISIGLIQKTGLIVKQEGCQSINTNKYLQNKSR